ncbi:MAG: SRPBCC domain-containing protein, partial [Sphingobium sp.]
ADIVDGRFAELVPSQRIVELVDFQSDDPAFAGTMKITTSLTPVPGGTEVAITCENVPGGISPKDHQAGMNSTLANLAAYIE